ncbi:hypothetical protein BGZ76_003643 [Entomortierella beljakovae]|nr:hypothetical protein BGZ76_003643 [Entomortierella beljakovae]
MTSSTSSSRSSSPRSPSPTPSSHPSHPLPDKFQIKLHLRKGQPLIRCRSTKDLPDPSGWDHHAENDSFEDFCAQISSRVANLEGIVWPKDGHPYIQTAHTTPQKRFKELNSRNLRARLDKAWRLESRRLSDDTKVFIHIYVYLQSSDGSSSRSAVDNRNGTHSEVNTNARKDIAQRAMSSTVAAGKKRKADSTYEMEEYRTIRIKVEGVVIPIQIELRSLKEALSLPSLK